MERIGQPRGVRAPGPGSPRPGSPSDLSDPAGPEILDIDRRVDRVLSEHRVLVATLERDLPASVRDGLLALRVPRPASAPVEARLERLATWSAEGAVDEEMEAARRARARLVADLQPTEFRPSTPKPLVTRGGVFYVPPRFEQARGFGEVADARLVRGGYLSADSVLHAAPDELARVTGHPLDVVLEAREDLDLTRLPGVNRIAADMLRFVGVHSVSRLADRDPVFLARELARLNAEHRFFRFPEVLDGERAVARLVSRAQDLAR